MNSALLKNWLTTSFGILAGLPVLVLASFPNLPDKYKASLGVVGGIGTIGLGVVSKAFNVHSTEEQVQNASQPKGDK
jgi:hypothetical protein